MNKTYKKVLSIAITIIFLILLAESFLQSESAQKSLFLYKLKKTEKKLLLESKKIQRDGLPVATIFSLKMPCFLYVHDSLVAWNTHQYTFVEAYDDTTLQLEYINNGWYLHKSIRRDDSLLVFQIPVFLDYDLNNEYVRPHFSSFFKGVNRLHLLPPDSENDEKFIELKKFNKKISYVYLTRLDTNNVLQWFIPFLLYLEVILLLILCKNQLLVTLKKTTSRKYITFLFTFSTTIVLWLLLKAFYKIPCWQGLTIAQPDFFAWNLYFPSLAEVINLFLVFFWFFILLIDVSKFISFNLLSKKLKYLYAFFAIIIPWILATLFANILSVLFFNSSWFSNFKDISTLNPFYLWLFVPIILNTVLIYLLLREASRIIQEIRFPTILILLFFIAGGAISFFIFNPLSILAILIVGTFLIIYYFLSTRTRDKVFEHIVLFGFTVLYLTIFTVLVMQETYHFKLKQSLKINSLRLSTLRDFLGEYIIENKVQTLLNQDSLVDDPTQLSNQLSKAFKQSYLSRFIPQVIICRRGDSMVVRPFNEKVDCYEYFNRRIEQNGQLVRPHVYYVKDDWRGYYLVHIPFSYPRDTLHAFVELLPVMLEKTMDYPNLLVDENADVLLLPSFISYAQYQNNQLFFSKGRFKFNLTPSITLLNAPYQSVFDNDSYYMLKTPIHDTTFILLVGEKFVFSSLWTAFSLVFIILLLGSMLLFLILFPEKLFSKKEKSITSNFQRLLVLFIVFSFGISVLLSIQNLLKFGQRKNHELLYEKALNLRRDLENNIFSDASLFNNYNWMVSYILNYNYNNLLEINVYKSEGKLFVTTKPEIFEHHLLSQWMNPDAYFKLKMENLPYLILRENIGRLYFYSAYFPIRSSKMQILGYVQVPYFTSEQQYNEELFSFLSSMVNIYLLLLLFGLFLAYVLTRHITKPLNIIKDHMKSIRLTGSNKKINWEGDDEISDLIRTYNAMIDELALKAKQLASSERELAWREMARQVAHEIKNPLTPMKLSTQYIFKAWQSNDKAFAEKFENYIKSMQMQIDSLTTIASSFASLGKLLQPDFSEKTKLKELFQDVRALFASDEFDFEIEWPEENLEIGANYQHVRQVLVNLVKNAIQAFVAERRGKIILKGRIVGDNTVEIVVIDNGRGISDEEKDKIFQPNFTTKSSGSGLGLAITKTIVEMYGGKITFVSKLGEGTTFFIRLPKM
jgi:signal transduction histidine kinase